MPRLSSKSINSNSLRKKFITHAIFSYLGSVNIETVLGTAELDSVEIEILQRCLKLLKYFPGSKPQENKHQVDLDEWNW